MSLPAASSDPPPASIYDSNDVPINDDDDNTSDKDGCNSNGSGNKGSDGKETEDAPPPPQSGP